MYSDFDIQKYNGPRINLIFTNFSKQSSANDDIMIKGLESESIGNNKEVLKNLIEKFRTELI